MVRHESARGGGQALRTGIEHALTLSPRVVASLDGDGQHDARDLERPIAQILARRADVMQAVGDPAATTPNRRALDLLASLLARYPVFPPDRHAEEVLVWLHRHPQPSGTARPA